jgi:hypothetical protein
MKLRYYREFFLKNQTSPVTSPQEYRDLNIGYDCDVQKLEITRKQQANAKEWYEARKNRLTASNFGKVMHDGLNTLVSPHPILNAGGDGFL